LGDPCGWLVQSKSRRLGVCTHCPTVLRVWESGERRFTRRALAAITERDLLERALRRRHVV
jgi:hypothetical protein